MKSKILLLVLLVLSAPFLAGGRRWIPKISTAAPGVLYDSVNVTGEGGWICSSSTSDYAAGQQNFTFSAACTVYYVDVPMTGHAFWTSFTDFTVSFYNRSGNNLGTVIASATPVTGSASWSHTLVRFTFSTPQSFTNGQQVHIWIGPATTPPGYGNTQTFYTTPSLAGMPGQLSGFNDAGINQYSGSFANYELQMTIYGTTP